MPACIPSWFHVMIMLVTAVHLADCSTESSMQSIITISSIDCSIKVACINDMCICHTDTVYITAIVNSSPNLAIENKELL